MRDTTVGGQHFQNRTMTFFNISTVQKIKTTIHTNGKTNNIHSKIQFCCQSELCVCMCLDSVYIFKGHEYKLHFHLTSCSSFKFSYTMKVMLFTVPTCLKARLYLVCACVCKSVEKSPIY